MEYKINEIIVITIKKKKKQKSLVFERTEFLNHSRLCFEYILDAVAIFAQFFSHWKSQGCMCVLSKIQLCVCEGVLFVINVCLYERRVCLETRARFRRWSATEDGRCAREIYYSSDQWESFRKLSEARALFEKAHLCAGDNCDGIRPRCVRKPTLVENWRKNTGFFRPPPPPENWKKLTGTVWALTLSRRKGYNLADVDPFSPFPESARTLEIPLTVDLAEKALSVHITYLLSCVFSASSIISFITLFEKCSMEGSSIRRIVR